MPTNHYFNNYIHNKTEHSVHMMLVDELIRNWGYDCYYIPRGNKGNEDLIFGEDVLKYFDQAYLLSAYQENSTQYMGEQAIFSRFGLEIRNEINIFISEIEFEKCVRSNNNQIRPHEGDLIYVPQLNKVGELYEIRYVNDNSSFSIFGKRQAHFYKLNLEKFKYSNENISTGVEEIDQIKLDHAYSKEMYYEDFDGHIEPFDIIYQSPDGTVENLTAKGTVTNVDECCKSFVMLDIAGEFKDKEPAYILDTEYSFILRNNIDDLTHAQENAGTVDNQLINMESKISVTKSTNGSGIIGTWE